MATRRIIDLTARQSDPPVRPERFRLRGGKVWKRNPKDVTGIVIHQTGVHYSVSGNQIEAAGGDRHEALHRRGLLLKAHMVVFNGKTAGVRCNHALHVTPLDWFLYHGHGLNSRSLGIEIEGNYPMKMKEELASPELVRAAREAIKYMVQKGRRMGMPIKYIWAHRQSSKNRGRDPGEELWKKVVLEYAVPVLGLKLQPDLTTGTGRSIPSRWGRAAIITGIGAGTVAVGVGAFFLIRALLRRRARGGSSQGLDGSSGGFAVFGEY